MQEATLPRHLFNDSVDVLVKGHRKADRHVQKILLSPDENEIRLVEVTPKVGYTGAATAFGFSAKPDVGVFFPSNIMLLNPQEWAEFLEGKLSFPPGWAKSPRELKELYSSG